MQRDQPRHTRRAAFFDVDNTLLNLKSMFSFQSFYLDTWRVSQGAAPSYAAFMHAMETHADRNDRPMMNRLFYRSYAGHRQDDVQAAAWIWFDELTAALGEALWIQPALARARQLQAAGHLLVAVSGSSDDILAPLIDQLGFDHCLATRLEARDGVLTGEIAGLQMIGPGKGEAMRRFAHEFDIDLAHCVACGDHVTDLPMLEAAGTALVVEGDPQLEAIARSRGWETLPAERPADDTQLAHI
jgi:HAD superfamily hydrolase (TIGR01490 family)